MKPVHHAPTTRAASDPLVDVVVGCTKRSKRSLSSPPVQRKRLPMAGSPQPYMSRPMSRAVANCHVGPNRVMVVLALNMELVQGRSTESS